MKQKNTFKSFCIDLGLGAITGIAFLLLTAVIYVGFVMNVIHTAEAMTPEVKALVSAESVNVAAQLVANILYGMLMVLVFRLGKIHSAKKGAIVGALIAILSDYYYALCLFSMTKNMFTLTSITIDALTYTAVGAIIGAILAPALKSINKKLER